MATGAINGKDKTGGIFVITNLVPDYKTRTQNLHIRDYYSMLDTIYLQQKQHCIVARYLS